MKATLLILNLAILMMASTLLCCAQQKPTTDPGMVAFFTGNWDCAGEFASGKKIEADVSFISEFDGKWLSYRHSDRPPGGFKAMAVWGVDEPSGKLVSVMEDNFGGSRLFTSDGWKDGSVTFTRTTMLEQKPSEERFRYERQSDKVFKMTYEKSVDGQWKMGDFIFCTRR